MNSPALELVAVFWYRPQVDAADPWLWLYVAVLIVITATGGFGWWAARQPGPAGVPEETRSPTPSGGPAG